MDDYDPLIEINDKPSRWIKEGALRMYNACRAQGKPIPAQLQNYIDNGLKRELEGLQAFPATRTGDHHPIKIYSMVRIQMEDNNHDLDSAIDMVAGELDMTERRIKDIYNEVTTNKAGVVYYMHSYLKTLK